MKFSVIMPSYLGPYKGSAGDRDIKIIRAIESVIMQSHKDFELIIVSDGCRKTVNLVSEYYPGHEKIKLIEIPKQKIWSGAVRSAGLKQATGEWVCYLDIDDYFGFDHLKILNENLTDELAWAYFSDYLLNRSLKLVEQPVNIRHGVGLKWRAGTSNIVHQNLEGITWDRTGYDHDARFIDFLRKNYLNYKQIPTPEYYVCHIPGKLDV